MKKSQTNIPSSPPSTTTLRMLWFWAILFFTLDQLSKWFILEGLNLATVHRIDVIPGYLHFIMAWNKGVNFGLFYNNSDIGRYLLIGLPILVAIGFSWWNRKGSPKWQALGCALIIGGALGNALDRIIHGAVVDFLNMTAFNIHNPYSFNLADTWIFFGAILLIFLPAPQDDSTKTKNASPGNTDTKEDN